MKFDELIKTAATIGVIFVAASSAFAQPVSSAAGATSSAVPAQSQRAADKALAKQVLKTLARVKGLDSTGIFVKSVDGNVTLSGVVPDASQIPLAVQSVRKITGVKSVRDAIRLQDRTY